MSNGDKPSETLADKLHGMGDTAYCTACVMSQKDLCLGEEAKIKTGVFTVENLKALEAVRAKFGEANGLWEAAKIARASAPSSTVPNYERCFHAACKALERLDAVRHMWNGPIHIAARLLRDATGPQPDAPASAPSATGPRWIPVSERLPEVKLGEEELVWVCAHRKHNGKRYVFAQHWVNRPYTEAEQDADWVICNEDGDPMNTVGWCNVGCNSSYDEFYVPIENPEEIIAWMPMEKPSVPADGSAKEKP